MQGYLLKKLTAGADVVISDARPYDELLPPLAVATKLVAVADELAYLGPFKGIDGVIVTHPKQLIGDHMYLIEKDNAAQLQKWPALLTTLAKGGQA